VSDVVVAPPTPARLNVMEPWLGTEEATAVAEVIATGWVAQGPRVAEFERAFAEAMHIPHAVATSSCTTALHLALLVAGVGAGDEVVVPSLSFIATTNAVRYVGASPVFADVDAATGNLTPASVASAITPRTRAVIAVDQGGMPVDLTGIRAVTDPRDVLVIEDAACGAGSTHRGRPVGAGAQLTAWSFHPRKVLTTGEGGMLTTDDAGWAARARRLREHGMSVSASERHRALVAPPEDYGEVGFNFRMTDLQAAVGLVQLRKLPAMVARRRELALRYREAIADVRGLRAVVDPEHGTSNFQSFWVEVGEEYPLDREGLLHTLAYAGISARRGIMAAHRQQPYRDLVGQGQLPNTERITDRTLILPLFHLMTADDQGRVVTVLRDPATSPGPEGRAG
jgi:dTDP-4-amino-4,6-dideoxygalactose transaminase